MTPTGRDFSEEQWREIYAARARFEAYANKIQPYPGVPDDIQPEHLIFRPRPVDKELDQLKSKMLWLQNKMNEKYDEEELTIADE